VAYYDGIMPQASSKVGALDEEQPSCRSKASVCSTCCPATPSSPWAEASWCADAGGLADKDLSSSSLGRLNSRSWSRSSIDMWHSPGPISPHQCRELDMDQVADEPVVLSLLPLLGTAQDDELPSKGSKSHGKGCTPCKFYRGRRGCRDGTDCTLCHFPHEEMTYSAIRRAVRQHGLQRRKELEALAVNVVAASVAPEASEEPVANQNGAEVACVRGGSSAQKVVLESPDAFPQATPQKSGTRSLDAHKLIHSPGVVSDRTRAAQRHQPSPTSPRQDGLAPQLMPKMILELFGAHAPAAMAGGGGAPTPRRSTTTAEKPHHKQQLAAAMTSPAAAVSPGVEQQQRQHHVNHGRRICASPPAAAAPMMPMTPSGGGGGAHHLVMLASPIGRFGAGSQHAPSSPMQTRTNATVGAGLSGTPCGPNSPLAQLMGAMTTSPHRAAAFAALAAGCSPAAAQTLLSSPSPPAIPGGGGPPSSSHRCKSPLSMFNSPVRHGPPGLDASILQTPTTARSPNLLCSPPGSDASSVPAFLPPTPLGHIGVRSPPGLDASPLQRGLEGPTSPPGPDQQQGGSGQARGNIRGAPAHRPSGNKGGEDPMTIPIKSLAACYQEGRMA